MDGDESSPWARRFRDLIELHLADLGSPDTLSEAQFSLCRRVAAMEVELERMEQRFEAGEKTSLDIYQRTSNSLTRILKTLGIERKAKVLTLRDRMRGEG